MNISEPRLWHRMPDGVVEGDGIEHNKKHLGEVAGLSKFKDIESKYDLDTIVYEVYSYGEGEESKQGNLLWGLTILYPVYIEGECNMTRGHFHKDKNCAEFYFGIKGEGLLVFMNDIGEMWAEKVMPGSLHYIDGRYAHRLVNTGDTELKVGACWPTTAGHDYAAIENKQFPNRIFKIQGKLMITER
jgi:glucose-6-phosphate isomerase